MSESVIKSGVLWKKGSSALIKNYKPRYFELCKNGTLNYYEVSKDGQKKLKGSIVLRGVLGVERQSDNVKNTHKLLILTQDRDWTLLCKNDAGGNALLAQQERDAWAAVLEQQIRSATDIDTKNTAVDVHAHNDEPPELVRAQGYIIQVNVASATTSGQPPVNPFYGGAIYAAASAPPLPEDCEEEGKQQTSTSTLSSPSSLSPHIAHTAHTAHIPFKLAEILSLKSELFAAWISFDNAHGCLRTTNSEPMVHERFRFQCLDDLNKVYTIQTSSRLYFSITKHGDVEFVAAAVGVYQQWCVEYHHINAIAIKSCANQQYFGIDNAGKFHCRYPSLTDIVKWSVSPPVLLTTAQQSQAIAAYHQTQGFMPQALHTQLIEWPQFPHDDVGLAFQICDAKARFLGVTDTAAKYVQCDFTNCQSFDGALLSRSTFYVSPWSQSASSSSSQLFTIKSALSNRYLSPPPPSSSSVNRSRVKLVSHATQRELFRVLWHDHNVISLVTYYGCVLAVDAGQTLCVDGGSAPKSACFRIHCKSFDQLNRVHDPQKTFQVPRPQLPVRNINGQMRRDIFLKSQCVANGDGAYLTLRSSPYRYEAASTMMTHWETIQFKHDEKRTHLHACIVTLYTANGLVIACSPTAQICFLSKDDESDELRCRWRVLFHHYAMVSVQNEKYKGWMRLEKNKNTNIYALCMSNPSFDAHGRPVINVEHAMQPFTDVHCRFALTPPANCKDLQYRQRQQQNHSLVASTSASASSEPVSFAM